MLVSIKSSRFIYTMISYLSWLATWPETFSQESAEERPPVSALQCVFAGCLSDGLPTIFVGTEGVTVKSG